MEAVDTYEQDYLQGGIDCRKGLPHTPGRSEAYNKGYEHQYELEQQLDHRTDDERIS